jgi:hypothetical protein
VVTGLAQGKLLGMAKCACRPRSWPRPEVGAGAGAQAAPAAAALAVVPAGCLRVLGSAAEGAVPLAKGAG